MMTFEAQLSGGEVGGKLADDAEELAYALETLTDETDARFIVEVGEHFEDRHGKEEVADFLRKLANAVEGAA